MKFLRPLILGAMIAAGTLSTAEVEAEPPGWNGPSAARGQGGYDPYVESFQSGYRYVPFPLNDPRPHVGPGHWVALYDYGFFGAKYRHPPRLNTGYFDYMRSYRRGFTSP